MKRIFFGQTVHTKQTLGATTIAACPKIYLTDEGQDEALGWAIRTSREQLTGDDWKQQDAWMRELTPAEYDMLRAAITEQAETPKEVERG